MRKTHSRARTVVLQSNRAFGAVSFATAERLGTNTNTVTDLDVLDIVTNANSLANNLMTDAAGYCLIYRD